MSNFGRGLRVGALMMGWAETIFAALTLVGTSECGMAREEARTLAHDVLLASVPHIGRVPDLRTWLTGAMTEADLKATILSRLGRYRLGI